MNALTSLLAGLLFGLGLVVSGMANPAKVLGFLDLFGDWDPSMAFVMLGALLVGTIAFHIAGKRTRALLGAPISLPKTRDIDRRLVLGSLAFGIGWGLAGYCPGPVITSLAVGGSKPWIFFLAMLAGMAIFELFERKRS
ncbi:YeeE/YedE family protein [Pseudoduganella sp. DS3]|uniref:YeeE/YedE family protein n=1 Tax=Pseudoduganella guangdongensis TaxID=2692179 RepID=A0A6N9HDD0_9BURK|nr:YeeE/YedE family protein [Pseudoduganella guangdongensis]MYN01446.1 YeeE/YedE family protein [Pseudoduganella guangdongensis]